MPKPKLHKPYYLKPYYLVVAVEGSVSWTQAETTVEYDGDTFLVKPGSDTVHRSVAVAMNDRNRLGWEEALQKVRRFLSSLAWAERGSVREVSVAAGGAGFEIGRNRNPGSVFLGPWRADYMPVPKALKARQALAFYREALGLQLISQPYAFLGFAKVLNLTIGPGEDQIAWINRELPHVRNHFASQRLKELELVTPNVGEYLYGSGRCAVAHALGATVNPDDAADTARIENDLPLIRALAERFIEVELGIKSQRTIWEEHLYELDGFRALFDPVVTDLRAGRTPTLAKPILIPDVSINVDHLLRKPDVANPTFDNLKVEDVRFDGGVAVLQCVSRDNRVKLLIGLDFQAERLLFDPIEGVAVLDDGSPEAIEHEIRRLRLLAAMLGNGRTQIYDASSGTLLGRTDPCIPVNIDPGRSIEAIDQRIASLTDMAQRRTRPNPNRV